ncbi:MAG TPA: toll/interleukin-1 receptor domain-containing protein [Anaerolineales bacterium]|nr:toll/interleukin-1 receptor domain-containing protein [Anaerolineales bacterium]
MKRSTRQANIFLIYAHSDKEAVRKLHQRIVKDGIHAWLDAQNLQPGQDWQHEIRRAILDSERVLVCLTRAFNKQPGYRHEELKIALEKAKQLDDRRIFIIPVRLERCEMPASLRHLHRVDLFEAGGYKKLLHALKKSVESG